MSAYSKSRYNILHDQNVSYSPAKTQHHSLPKLTVSLENQQYTLPINQNSTIQKLALELMIMIYEELLQQQLNEQSKQIHSKICQILLQQVISVIKKQTNPTVRNTLLKIVNNYNTNHSLQQRVLVDKNKYFVKNYLKTLAEDESENSYDKSFTLNEKSKSTNKLYQNGKKSIQRKTKLYKQNIQQKSKVEISYCTFHPNISKSQSKLKPKDGSNVFQRLYADADQIKIKNFFKKIEAENQEQKIDRSFKFIPEINECSKRIARLKDRGNDEAKLNFQDSDKSQLSFQTSKNSSQKYLKEQTSRKVFDKLYNVSFYENRLNKTIQKISENKENEYSFHPQLSEGTKRLTKNYPKLENRLKFYETKRTDKNQKQSPSFSRSKEKIMKKNYSKVGFNNSLKDQVSSKGKKGIRRMLEIIKTEPNQQLQLSLSSIQLKKPIIDRYNSEIFRVQTEFIDDDSQFDITPKKLNLQPFGQKIFFKNKINTFQNSNSSYLPESYNQSNLHESIPKEKQSQNKEKIFEKIFFYFSQNENEITAKNIGSKKDLPQKIKEIFEPMTDQLTEMDTELDKEEFIWSLQNLYDQLEPEEKAVLLAWGLKFCTKTVPSSRNFQSQKHMNIEGTVYEFMD